MMRTYPGVELYRLRAGLYWLIGFALIAALIAHLRIYQRQIALDIDAARAAHDRALAQNHRLKLELASIEDPANLQGLARALGFDQSVIVIDVE